VGKTEGGEGSGRDADMDAEERKCKRAWAGRARLCSLVTSKQSASLLAARLAYYYLGIRAEWLGGSIKHVPPPAEAPAARCAPFKAKAALEKLHGHRLAEGYAMSYVRSGPLGSDLGLWAHSPRLRATEFENSSTHVTSLMWGGTRHVHLVRLCMHGRVTSHGVS
jgi:hypothetical protein